MGRLQTKVPGFMEAFRSLGLGIPFWEPRSTEGTTAERAFGLLYPGPVVKIFLVKPQDRDPLFVDLNSKIR